MEQVKQELQDTGYRSKVYYRNSFTVEKAPEKLNAKQDLIYKSVTDIATIRQWSLKDKNLIHLLSEKNLCLPPSYFNETFLKEMRENNQKILGAEILVIEAIKS